MARDGADPILERVVEQASELLHAPKVGLAVIEADVSLDDSWSSEAEAAPVLRFVATRGLSDQFAERIRPTHWRDGTTAMAIHERRPVWSADLLNDPSVDLTDATRRAVEAEGYRAVLSVPLHAKGELVGVLSIADSTERDFTDAEVALLTLCDRCGRAEDDLEGLEAA